MVLLTLMLACGGPSEKADADPLDDTAADTADTGETADTEDSGDTGETGDSGDSAETGETGDTGDTGDTAPVDADGDGYPSDVDCDDADPTVHPGATDDCNGVDDDCDGTFEEDSSGTAAWRAGARYATLALAVSGASVGEVISLCPGTYVEQVSPREPVTIEGWARDPARTILDGNGVGPIVSLSDYVDRPDALTLRHLTLRNGDAGDDRGGAVLSTAANVRVEGCVFEDNVAAVGGAIAAVSAESVWLEDTVFRGNHATDAGGAVYMYGSRTEKIALTTTGVTFEDNSASEEGGAIAADIEGYGNIYPQYATFSGNSAGTLGGAMAVVGAKTVRISTHSSSFAGNSAGTAGAVYAESLERVEAALGSGEFTDNHAGAGAGAVLVTGEVALLDASGVFHRNVADDGSCAAVGGYGELEGDWGEGADDNVGCDLTMTLCDVTTSELGAEADAQCYEDGRWVVR